MSRLRKAIAVVICLVFLVSVAPVRATAPAAATPIQHVIIIVQENHSFDNYFGTYPTANGTLVTPITSELPAVNGIPDGVCLPYGSGCVRPQLSNSTSPTNPVEGQSNYEADYSKNGTGFPVNSGVQSMVYFDYHAIPAYWDYAEEYGLADNYYTPFLAQSNPNRLAMLSGDSPTSSDSGPPPYLPYNETIMHQLDVAGINWGYFDYYPASAGVAKFHFLNFISGMTAQEQAGFQSVWHLTHDLSSGSGLPAVSFVDSLGNKTYDEHPSSNPTVGEEWVVSLVNDVMSSTYWSDTAIFITWDEGGGFYDHVIPPTELSVDHNFSSPLLGLGQRIPLLVISPYSREAYVSNTLMSHLSLTHFIDYNWNLPALNANVGSANLPLGFFNFSGQPRAPLILGQAGPDSMTTYPIPLQIPLTQPSSTQTSQSTTGAGSSPTPASALYAAVVIAVAVVLAGALVMRRSGRHATSGDGSAAAPLKSGNPDS